MMEELISVIVPVYNVVEYLTSCVTSIVEQSYDNLEIILVDDGSTDGSGELCDELAQGDKRIIVLHQQNRGLSAARNRGLSIATGKWIGFVDSDDIIHRDLYNTLWRCVHSSSYDEVIVQILRENFVDGSVPLYWDAPLINATVSEEDAKDYLQQLLLHTGDPTVCSKLFKREFFDDIKYNENITGEDLELMVRLIEKYKLLRILTIDGYGYFYREREGSITHSGYSKNVIDSIYIADFIYKIVEQNYPELINIAKRYYLAHCAWFLRIIPLCEMRKENKHYGKVVKYIRKSLLTIICNSYLTFCQKRNLLAFCLCPKLVKRTYAMLFEESVK